MSRPAALVVAPHADDESIGCGGTLVALAERGFDVEVLLVTRPEPVGRRREEHAAALRTLGARSGPGLELPQQRIVADEAAVAGVLAVLRRLRPALVLAPHRLELDRDHRETHRIVTAALQADRWTADVEPPLLWEYEVWTALAYPHLLVDISERVRHKRSAIGCYSSQLVEHDYVAAALGLNAYRGVMLGPGRGYCEAFAQATPPTPATAGSSRTMYVLGVNGWSRGCHDPSAALLRDGELVCAVEEERLLRRKHALDRLPHLAIDYCLGAAGITAAEIDHVAVGWDGNHLLAYSTGRPHAQASEGVLREVYLPHSLFPERGDRAMPVTCVDHHRAHAAGAFAASGFREALVVVIDGSGEYESTTLLRASAGGRLELLRRYPFSCSIGLLYDALTLYLGFGRFHHGKVMGLAAHGTPRFELPDLDLDAEAPPRDPARRDHEQAVVDHWLRTFESLTGRGTLTHPRTRQVDDGLRRSDASEPSALHRDLAASAQAWLEQQVCRMVRHGVALCGLHDVVITGGVGLSCPANFRVLGLPEVDRVYVPSAPGDAGVSLGAACAVSWAAGVEPRLDDAHCYAGPSASDAQVAALLRRCGLTALQVDEPARVVADELLRGRVVAWFHDGLELGPRALGHRSILASPLELETRHRVNRIKGREPWRPLAPSVLAESTTDHFEGDPHSPFMSFSAPVREATARRAPAIVHEDGTARLQTVHRDTTPAFWTAIDAFGRDSGLPIVMNTSFNVGPEPLVCSPLDALRTFWASGLDTLVLESFVLRKDG